MQKQSSDLLFVDRPLAHRLENAQAWRGVRYADAQRALKPHIESTVLAIAGGQALYAGPGSPVNHATGLGMEAPVTHADLEAIEQFYRSRNAMPRIEVCPLADPSLLELVGQSSYRLEHFKNVLVSPLPCDVPPSPEGLQISRAGPDEADLWLKTVAQGFTESDTPPSKDFNILTPNFYSANATCFFAWLDGQPAGGGGMYIHDRVAEFGGASTRVAFRQRGVQTALLYHRLAAAQAAGCDLALVVTTPGTVSQRNVERVGFRLAYTKAMLAGL